MNNQVCFQGTGVKSPDSRRQAKGSKDRSFNYAAQVYCGMGHAGKHYTYEIQPEDFWRYK